MVLFADVIWWRWCDLSNGHQSVLIEISVYQNITITYHDLLPVQDSGWILDHRGYVCCCLAFFGVLLPSDVGLASVWFVDSFTAADPNTALYQTIIQSHRTSCSQCANQVLSYSVVHLYVNTSDQLQYPVTCCVLNHTDRFTWLNFYLLIITVNLIDVQIATVTCAVLDFSYNFLTECDSSSSWGGSCKSGPVLAAIVYVVFAARCGNYEWYQLPVSTPYHRCDVKRLTSFW